MIQLFFTPKQTIALEELSRNETSELLFGGSKGGGKSVFGCQWALLRAYEIIEQCNIKEPLEYPIPIGFMGRKRGVDFNKTTLETWKRFIPSNLYSLRSGDKEIIIENKVKYFYGGLDDEENIKKFNSAEFAVIFIDQAEEISRTDLGLAKGTLRLIINDIKPSYKILLTCNPAPCFLKDDYILAPQAHQRFIPSLPRDNPFLGPEYEKTLREAFKHRPELVRAYVEGSWDDLEGSDLLIQHSWVLKSVDAPIHMPHDRRVTSCDVARYGDCETVIYNLIDNKITDAMIYGPKDTTISAANIINMAAKNKSDLIAIDADGMGGPVVDMVRQLLRDKESKLSVLEIHSGKQAENDEAYVNSRSEMWFYASKLFAEHEISINNDNILIGQLSSIKYSPNGSKGRFQIEKKEETKKRLEHSPDRADALVYGLWAITKVAKKQFDFKRTVQPLIKQGYGWETVTSRTNYGL